MSTASCGAALLWHKTSMTPKRIFMLGATGTIGRATLAALTKRGHQVVGFARTGTVLYADQADICEWRFGDVTDLYALQRDGFRGEKFDVLLSCMASRTGNAADAWAIDHRAHLNALQCARSSGVTHMVLLSAICVQKALLAFQHAKLAFEDALMTSGIDYSIVRPTAFFNPCQARLNAFKTGNRFCCSATGI